MSFKAKLSEALAQEARLYILKELAAQDDGRLSIILIKRVLDSYEIRRDRDWIETQLRKLESLGAITIGGRDAVLIARIERAGRDHIEERSQLAGVMPVHEAEG